MTELYSDPPEWIDKYLSLRGGGFLFEESQIRKNPFLRNLGKCCPQIFESYAVILHPFWIHWEAKKLVDSGQIPRATKIDFSDYKRINWSSTFELFHFDFDFETAIDIDEKIAAIQRQSIWPEYLLFPAQGDCEVDDLESLLSRITEFVGQQTVNYYYCNLQIEDVSDEHRIFNGDISEFKKLQSFDNILRNPNSIYPDNQDWCIVSDYDLPFTFVAGSSEMINAILDIPEIDIHLLKTTVND